MTQAVPQSEQFFGNFGDWRYVNLKLDESKNLVMRWIGSQDESNEFMERAENGESDVVIMYDILEDCLTNGWFIISPESIGALTGDSNIILSEVDYGDPDYNNDPSTQQELDWYPVYAYDRYMIDNYVKALIQYGYLTFKRYEVTNNAQ